MRATASAANTALPSSRTSMTRMPARLRAGQDRRDVAAAQREQVRHAVTREDVRDDVSAMLSHGGYSRSPCYRKRRGAAVSNLVLYSIPAFIVVDGARDRCGRARHPDGARGYETRDTLASLSMGLLNVGDHRRSRSSLSIPFFAWLYEHRIADLGQPDRLVVVARPLVRRGLLLLLVPPHAPRGALPVGRARQPPLEPALQPVDGAAPAAADAVHRADLLGAARRCSAFRRGWC